MDEEFRRIAGSRRPPRPRGMVGLLVPVIAGTAAGLCVPLSPVWFWAGGMGLVLPLFLWVRRGWSTMPLLAAVFLLTAAHARMAVDGRSAESLAAAIPRPMEYVQFVARATEDAVARTARPGRAPAAVFRARVEGLNRDGAWRRMDDTIRVVLRGRMDGRRLPRYGERWWLRGVVRPSVPRRSGLFTLPENQAVIDTDRAFFLDAGRGNPVVAWCLDRRRAARAVLARGLEDFPAERGLLQALLLGYRENLPPLLRQDFAATGTVHIFAISGAHVGMVALLLAGLLRALGVPKTRWFLIVMPALGAYVVATGAATSAIRAAVMAGLLLAAPFWHRKPDAISTLAAAAAAILLAAPRQLGDLGFLLSFTAVAGLLAVQPIFDLWAIQRFRRDDWQLEREERPAGRRWRETGQALTRFGSMSGAAWLSTAPMTAFFFNLVSPVALAMNLVVIPAAFAILLAGVCSLASAAVSAELPEIFNHAARALAQGLAFLIRRAAAVPGGHAFVRTPPAAGVVLWYAVLGLAAVAARRVKGALPAGLALLAALTVAWGMREARRCRVTVLDTGEGNAVLVQAQGRRILIDSGPAYRAEDTLRQLRREGVNRLDVLAATHSDAAHMGASVWLMKELPVAELWLPAETWSTAPMRRLLAAAEEADVPVCRLAAGAEGAWPGGMAWQVLWPPAGLRLDRSDAGSLVLRVARYGAAVLLMSDAGASQEKAMLRSGESVAAPVLLAGRHGDSSATSERWLNAVRPRDVLVSSGPHAEERHPDEEMLERLAQRDIRVWRTDRQGMIYMDFAGEPARWPDPGYTIRTEW